MLNGTGRWIIPCAALSLDKFKGSPTIGHHGRIGTREVWLSFTPSILVGLLDFKPLVYIYFSFFVFHMVPTHVHIQTYLIFSLVLINVTTAL